MRAAVLVILVLLLASACSDASRAATTDSRNGSAGPGYATTLHEPGAGTFLYGPRAHHTATLLSDGRVLIVGGTTGNRLIAECEIYDPSTGQFFATAPLNTPRRDHATVLLGNGQVLATAGFDGRLLLDTVELFVPGTRFSSDPSDASWRIVPVSLPFPRAQHRAVALPGLGPTAMLLVGGVTGAGTEAAPTSGTDLFVLDLDGDGDPRDASVRFLAQPRFARTGHSLTLLPGPDGATGTYDDWMLAYGGLGVDPLAPPVTDPRLVVLGEPEIYLPWEDRWYSVAANQWYPSSPQFVPDAHPETFAGPRKDHRAVLLTDGRVLLVGGSNGIPSAPDTGGNSLVQRAEVFVPDYADPARGRFVASALLASPRQGLSATAVSNGRAVIVGGYDGSAERIVSTVEVYLPGTAPAEDRFDPAGVLHVSRVYHTATLLPAADARIVLLGGITGAGDATIVSEIFRLERAVAIAQ